MKKKITTPAEWRKYNRAIAEVMQIIQEARLSRMHWWERWYKSLKTKVIKWYTRR